MLPPRQYGSLHTRPSFRNDREGTDREAQIPLSKMRGHGDLGIE